jgi:hypothetical protein
MILLMAGGLSMTPLTTAGRAGSNTPLSPGGGVSYTADQWFAVSMTPLTGGSCGHEAAPVFLKLFF